MRVFFVLYFLFHCFWSYACIVQGQVRRHGVRLSARQDVQADLQAVLDVRPPDCLTSWRR